MRFAIISSLLFAISGCASRPPAIPPVKTPASMPASDCPVYFEEKGDRGFYIYGHDQRYFSENGVKVPKGQELKMSFLIANGLESDVFFANHEPLVWMSSITTSSSFEGGGGAYYPDRIFKYLPGRFRFVSNGQFIDDSFVLGSVTLPDHSEGKTGDVDVQLSFYLCFYVCRTGKWEHLTPSKVVHVHYE